MKTIIAGSRRLSNVAYLDAALQTCPFVSQITSVVCGGATGIDALGDRWAALSNLPVWYFLITSNGRYDYERLRRLKVDRSNATIVSDWYVNGNAAGPIRNEAMAKFADALIAVPLKGARKGTDSMIRLAERHGLTIHVHEVTEWKPPTPRALKGL
jgi:hypothetical protein